MLRLVLFILLIASPAWAAIDPDLVPLFDGIEDRFKQIEQRLDMLEAEPNPEPDPQPEPNPEPTGDLIDHHPGS